MTLQDQLDKLLLSLSTLGEILTSSGIHYFVIIAVGSGLGSSPCSGCFAPSVSHSLSTQLLIRVTGPGAAAGLAGGSHSSWAGFWLLLS